MTDPSSPATVRLSRGDLLASVGVLCLALGLLVGWRSSLGLTGALGRDAPIWGLTAEGLHRGAPAAVPPAWPALLALLRDLGQPLIPAAMNLSLTISALTSAGTVLCARALGARRAPALAAGLLVLACPDLIGWSAELQSNGLVALALVLTTGLWAHALSQPPSTSLQGTSLRSTTLLAAVLTGVLPLIRENMLVVTLVAILAAPLAFPRGWRLSLIILGSWWCSPLLVGVLPGASPTITPWSSRSARALADLQTGAAALPNYVGEVARDQRKAYIDHLRQGDLAALAAFHFRRSLSIARDGWLLAAGALLALGIGWRRRSKQRSRQRSKQPHSLDAALLPLAMLGPSLVIWTQRRHVMMAAPALIAVVAAAWSASPRQSRAWTSLPRLVLAVLTLVAVWSWPAQLVDIAHEQQGDTLRAASLQDLASWICSQDLPLLGGPIQDVALYCPRPHHDPDGTAADWYTLVVLPARAPPLDHNAGWVTVGPHVADMAVRQLRPQQPRPCGRVSVPLQAPLLAAGPTHVQLAGCPPTSSVPTP